MRFKAQIDGTEQRVVVSADGALALGSEGFQTTVTRLSSMKRLVKIGEKSYEVRLLDSDSDPAAGKYLFELNGELIPVEVSDVVKGGEMVPAGPAPVEKKAEPALDAVSGGIAAPMPGKIVDILARPGDKVEPGQVLVVLEAMKMENELSAISKGTVKAVVVEKGDSVQGGQVLVTLE